MRLETDRLILREWEDSDRAPYIAFNADREVRRYFNPDHLAPEATNKMVDGMIAALARDGFGFLACERKSDGVFIGEIGLRPVDQLTKDAMERPCDVELGWLLGREYWGNGYATEAASAWLTHCFDVLHMPEVGSLAHSGNAPSIRVMEKLGMTRDAQVGFEDPTLPVGHWQRPHVIYRIANPA